MPNVIWIPLFVNGILTMLGVEDLPDISQCMLLGLGLMIAELVIWGLYRLLRNYLKSEKNKISNVLLNHEQAICPHCKAKIGLKLISNYLLKGTNYSIQCPNCKRTLRPKREPIKMYYCVCAGFISVAVPFWLYIRFVEDDFWKAILLSIITVIICIVIVGLLTIKKIEFK